MAVDRDRCGGCHCGLCRFGRTPPISGREARRLRDIFPAEDVARLKERVSDEFIDRLVREVTTGFKGDVGVVPRQFLREFVTQMDLVDENDDYIPMDEYGFKPEDLSDQEKLLMSGIDQKPEDDDELVLVEDAW